MNTVTTARSITALLVATAVVSATLLAHRHGTDSTAKKSSLPLVATSLPVSPSDQLAAAAPKFVPLPTDATSVPDEYLLRLSNLVDLANAKYRRPDKQRWEQAIPIAQQLLSGPCDCEQRNWLNHFVEMGTAALTDADDDYYVHANLMATLGRNDADAMAISHRPRTN